MNIGILSQLKEKELTGINKMTAAVLAELKNADKSNKYYFLGNSDWLNIDFDVIKIFMSNDREIPLNYTIYTHQLDIVHSYYRPFEIDQRLKCGKVLTIHDLIPLVCPEWGTKKDFQYFDVAIRNSAKQADVIIAMSEYTKQDIIKHYNISEDKIKVVYSGLYPWTTTQKKIDSLERKRFILSVSALNLNKNQDGLLKAFVAFKNSHPDSDIKLVLTGPIRNSSAVKSILQQYPKYNQDVIYTGYVSEEELQWLYSKAEAFLYVSFYEGFGLPILEAMAKGKAVICSNVTSMPEVGGTAVEYCDPYQTDSIVSAMESVLLNSTRKKELEEMAGKQAAAFTFQRAAEQVLEIYRGFE